MGIYKRHIKGGGKVPRTTEFRLKRYEICNMHNTTVGDFVRTRKKKLKKDEEDQEATRIANTECSLQVNSEESTRNVIMEVDASSNHTGLENDNLSRDDFLSRADSPPGVDSSSSSDPLLKADSPPKMDSLPTVATDSSPEATEFKKTEEPSEDLFGNLKIPFCSCTKATVADVIFLVLILGLRFNWTWESQIAIFQGLNEIYENKKIPVENKYNFFKIIEEEKDSLSYHVYCPGCYSYIGERDVKEKGKLECPHCKSKSDFNESSNFFLSISIESQLKKMLENFPDAAELISKYRFQRKKIIDDAYEDLYDGEEYQKHFLNNGILSEPFNFSYSFFIDGVPLGKSSKRSLWPIYLTINELPFEERKKYVILAGLYVGPHEPKANFFLPPFVNQANKLAENGFCWTYENKEVKSLVIPLISIADSAFRYQLLNMQSYAGRYGCTFCYLKSERILHGQRFLVSEKKVKERTLESTKNDLRKLQEKQKTSQKNVAHYKGVKGFTPLLNLFYFNLISGFVVDYMHNVLLGVIKQHMELLLDFTNKKCWRGMDNIGIDHLIKVIDSRIKNITPPTCITRNPRSLSERNLWKANEWRSWLLFYSLPVLHDLLETKYFLHLAMLSKATFILLQKSITKEQLNETHNLLLSYVFYYQKYFKESNMTYNIHLLTHIAKGVKNWGPVWGHNAFLYEGENRYLLHFYKSPFHVLQQVTKKYLILNSIPSLSSKLSVNSRILNFCHNKFHKRIKTHFRLENCVLLGKGQPAILSPEQSQAITSSGPFLSYKKMIYHGVRYTTLKASNDAGSKKKDNARQVKKDDSYFFLNKGKELAKLEKILKNTESTSVILLIQKLLLDENSSWKNDCVRIKHIRRITGSGELQEIKFEDIYCPAVITIFGGKSFACPFPYGCLGD